jgi:subtilisin family serine protease
MKRTTTPTPCRAPIRGLHAFALGLALAFGLAGCGGGGGADPAPDGAQRVLSAGDDVAGDVIVMLVSSAVDAPAVAASVGATVVDRFGQRPIYRLRLPAGASLDAALATLARDARVRFAESNVVNETPTSRFQYVWAVGGDAGAFTAQWVPQALALPQAHALATGAGVRVAVLDTGVDLAHPAFAGRLAARGDGSLLGRDFVDDDADPSEGGRESDRGWGHGTHVAGLVTLAAPDARLIPVRVLDSAGRGNAWVLAEALMWAIDPDGNPATDDGAHVVNLSIGTPRQTRLMNAAIELATCSDDDDDEQDDDYSDIGFDADRARCNLRPGVVVMAAAGNGGSATERQYPAAEAAEGQLAVAATDAQSRLAAFSNRGDWVQLAAPGERVLSPIPGGRYATWSGTSMAAPLAAGVAALVLQRNPDWKPVDVTKRLLDRSVALCDAGALRGLHALGAVADFVPGDPACR